MTTNKETTTMNRETERKLIKKAKKIRKTQRTNESQVLLLTIAYDEEVINKETGEREDVEKTLDVFVPKLGDITPQEYARVIRTARKQGEESAMDHMMETFLGETTYEFILEELDNDIYVFVAEKLSDYIFGKRNEEDSPAKN